MTKKRGRKSAASKSLKVVETLTPPRPDPPDGMNARQMDIWNAVVRTEPIGFFATDAQAALLADYCRHRDTSEKLSQAIDAVDLEEWMKDADGPQRFNTMSRMRDRETRAVITCATKLRLTNQARYTPKAAGTKARNQPSTDKPWSK